MKLSRTQTQFRLKRGLTALALFFSFLGEAQNRCDLEVALSGQVALRLNQVSLTLAAKKRRESNASSFSPSERTQLLQEIQEAYRGILTDSLQILGPAEIAQLTQSSGRNVQDTTSGSLVLTTQEAIDRLAEYANNAGIAPFHLEETFSAVLTELFSKTTENESAKAPVPGKVAKLFLPSIETGTGPSQRNLLLRFPAYQDDVFASNAKGEIYRLPLSSASQAKPEWELVFQTRPSASGAATAFDVSRDGTLLAVDEQDALTLYNLQREQRVWSTPSQPQNQVVFSPTGDWVACLAENAPVLLVDGKSGSVREIRLKKNGESAPTRYSVTATEGWERNLIQSVSFSLKGDRMFLQADWALDVDLDLKQKKLTATRLYSDFRGFAYWGEFEDGRRLFTSKGYNKIDDDGARWDFKPGRHLYFGHLASHPRTRNIFLSAPAAKPGAFVSIWELEKDWPAVHKGLTFDAVNQPETVRGLEISVNGRLLAVQSEKATYFWNVHNPKSPKLIFRLGETFPDLAHSKAASFSASGRFFTGVSSRGKILTLDLSQHRNWPSLPVP